MLNTHDAYLRHGLRHNVPRLLVVHAMAEYVIDGDRTDHAVKFLDRYGLSAHALVAPSGDVYLCRREDEGAYHARGFNEGSLGVEFLVAGEHDYGSFIEAIKRAYVTREQYAAGLEWIRQAIGAHPITRVARHSELSPGRKVDPGTGFPWWALLEDVGCGRNDGDNVLITRGAI